MRIAGGVLIIIASLFDFMGGVTYAVLGAGAGLVGAAAKEAQNQAKTSKDKETAEKVGQALSTFGSLGMPYGVFLLVLGGLAIACGVVLFMGKAAIFAIIVGVLQVVAEGVSFVVLGVNIFNIFGLVAAIFVIIGALTYPKKQPAMAM